MNSNYKINLSHIPSNLDLFHITLAVTVMVLALILVFILLIMVLNLLRKLKKAQTQDLPEAVTQAPAIEPEPRIIEKIVEVEKIVPGPAPEPVILKESTPDAALQLLSLLQKEARFIDFIKEDVTAYQDADIGAAARVVHDGCNKVLNENFKIEPVRQEQENSRITIPEGFDASKIRLIGNVVGKAPFSGSLVHKGWQVSKINLPKITKGHNVNIVAAAEVEL